MAVPGSAPPPISTLVSSKASVEERVQVTVSYEVLSLLSAQLYASPLKAIEELVVNSWDADAAECRVYVPPLAELAGDSEERFVAVLDNGNGMALEELRDLWHVGLSHKREAGWKTKATRNQIGKFGIGKLATYSIARQVTYLTRQNGHVRGVSLNFDVFRDTYQDDGTLSPITLDLLSVSDPLDLLADDRLATAAKKLGTSPRPLLMAVGRTGPL